MFLGSRSIQQVAALPFVPLDEGFEVLLITSRRRGRWLLPKGWSSGKRSLAEAARREAAEEAGVIGAVDERSIGSYSYGKNMRQGYMVQCTVFVYPLLVLQHKVTWREKSERTLRWCSLSEAAKLADDQGLGNLLADIARSGGDALRAAVVRAEDAAVT